MACIVLSLLDILKGVLVSNKDVSISKMSILYVDSDTLNQWYTSRTVALRYQLSLDIKALVVSKINIVN